MLTTIFIVVFFTLCCQHSSHAFLYNTFSGVYRPNTTKSGSDFSAAWLVSKTHFLKCEANLNITTNMAGVSFAVVRKKYPNVGTFMTRDYFDFMVEHLSATSNQIPYFHEKIFQEEYRKLKETAKSIRQDIAKRNKYFDMTQDKRKKKTIAALIYSSIAFSAEQSTLQSEIRIPFFEATFWSTFRHFPTVVVYVADEKDEKAVAEMDIPAWKVHRLKVPFNHNNHSVALPRYGLLHLVENMKNNPEYASFEYVFFTEGDQVIHFRQEPSIYDLIDGSDGSMIAIPHRMQTLPLAQDFSPDLEQIYPVVHALNIPNATVVEENLFKIRGSCCDNGYYEVAKCRGWWYQCNQWGLKDMKPWLKFGPTGFTMPPVTVHRRSCEYHPNLAVCPTPKGCGNRVPKKRASDRPINSNELCHAFPDTIFLGPSKKKGTMKKAGNVTVEEYVDRIQQLQQENAKLRKKLRSCNQRTAQL